MANAGHIRLTRDDDMAKVLVVDDDTDARDFVARFLTKSGYDVATAPTGRAALMLLVSDIPDVIVLDMMMPEMNGAEFLSVIRRYLRWAELPVVVLTAYPESPEVARARELGVSFTFVKTT